MSKPPKTIDNAKVLYWALSRESPFGVVTCSEGGSATEIFGLAICRYDNSELVYRFSCDCNWETEQDSTYASAEEAMRELPEQYKEVAVHWCKYE